VYADEDINCPTVNDVAIEYCKVVAEGQAPGIVDLTLELEMDATGED
jgi:hypothetical protein